MQQPSDRFSDIGQFVESEEGWWFGKQDGNHAGLQKRLADLGIDVPIHAPDAEKGNWFPAEGAVFHATDTETRYTGDGKDWIEEQSTGTSPNVESVNAESANIETVNSETVSSTAVDSHTVTGLGVFSRNTIASDESLTVPSGRSYVVSHLQVERGGQLTVERGGQLTDVGGR